MKGFFVIALSVLFVVAVAAYAVWRGFKKGGGCSCADKSGSCAGCCDGKDHK